MNIAFTDLTQRPPRSPRTRLGGYVHLPRLLDKGRATLMGKNGEYNFDCPLDQQFFSFIGIKSSELLEQLAANKSDGEILTWIRESAPLKRSPYEIAMWSAFQEQRGPSDLEMREYYQEEQKRFAPQRDDLNSWFDLLDLDDYCSFGGKP